MARHQKTGIDYFSHDTDTFADQQMRFIIAKYGVIGYGVYFALLEKIYKNKGYYLELSEDFKTIFTADYRIGVKEFTNLIDDLLSKELFNKSLFNKHNILTSRRIQENYLKGCERRTEINLIKEFLLVNPKIIIVSKKDINVNINPLDVSNNPIDSDIGTQRKVKESKEEENILSENPTDFFSRLTSSFSEIYKELKKVPYKSNTGKDKTAISQMLQFYKKNNPDANTEQCLTDFQALFRNAITFSLTAKEYYQTITLAKLNSEFNNYVTLIQNGKENTGMGIKQNGQSRQDYLRDVFEPEFKR